MISTDNRKWASIQRLELYVRNLVIFCRQRPLFCLLVTAIILFRLFLPLRNGAFGPDESLIALRTQSILKGDSFPLIWGPGNFLFPYGSYSLYFLALIYGMTGFHLGWSLFIASIVLMSAPFLLAGYIAPKSYPFWTFLLALTSPVAIHYSLSGLWSIQFFIPLSALVLYIGRSSSPQKTWKEFLIGLLLGVGIGTHPQIMPFVAGIFVWRILVTRRKEAIINLIVGIFIAVLPYLIGLWQIRNSLHFTLSSPTYPSEAGIRGFLVFFSSLFRFFGAHPAVHMFPPGGWLYAVEKLLAQLTIGITISILFVGAYYFWKSGRKHLSIKSPLVPFLLCAAFYLPVAYMTNTGFQPHNGMALWWFAPLVIPPVIMAVLPKRAAIGALWLLITFNLIIVVIQYTPHIVNGTQASFAYGQGPSWWAYEEVVSTVCAEVNNQASSQGSTIVEMSGDPWNERIRYILANLIKLKHPDCAQRVQFIWSDTSPGRVLRVEPDPDKIHLRVVWVTR